MDPRLASPSCESVNPPYPSSLKALPCPPPLAAAGSHTSPDLAGRGASIHTYIYIYVCVCIYIYVHLCVYVGVCIYTFNIQTQCIH